MTRARDAGFTLLETLIALSIIAALASVTVLSLGGARSGGAEAEARRLASGLHLAVDETLVTGARHALEWDEDGYGFVVWNPAEGTWSAPDAQFLAKRNLADPLRLDIQASKRRILIGADGFGAPIMASVISEDAVWGLRFDGFTASVSPALR